MCDAHGFHLSFYSYKDGAAIGKTPKPDRNSPYLGRIPSISGSVAPAFPPAGQARLVQFFAGFQGYPDCQRPDLGI